MQTEWQSLDLALWGLPLGARPPSRRHSCRQEQSIAEDITQHRHATLRETASSPLRSRRSISGKAIACLSKGFFSLPNNPPRNCLEEECHPRMFQKALGTTFPTASFFEDAEAQRCRKHSW